MEPPQIPDFEPLSLIGVGAFGYVLEAYDRKNDKHVAIKRSYKITDKLSREIEISYELKNCPNVVKILNAFYSISEDKKLIQNIVFEYINKNLEKYIDNYKLTNTYIPMDTIKKITKQLLTGIKYCHDRYIVHRDLKPDNIMITEDEQIKIGDFGTAKYIFKSSNNKIKTKSTPYVVTMYYRAPELCFGKIDYDSKIDIFSLGCIIAELITRNILFYGQEEGMQIFEYIKILGIPSDDYLEEFQLEDNVIDAIKKFENIKVIKLNDILNINKYYDKKDIDEACDLIYNMLDWDYNKRYTAEECLLHPFIKDVEINFNKKNENNFKYNIKNKNIQKNIK